MTMLPVGFAFGILEIAITAFATAKAIASSRAYC